MFSINRLINKKGWFAISFLVITLDQITKHWAVVSLQYGEPKAFLPYFNFTLLHNYGAAFSFLSDAGGWQRWFFGVVAFAVSLLLIMWIAKLHSSKKWELAGLAFILGGAIGNLYDRIVLGYVVDFVDWFYPAAEGCLPFFYARAELQTCHWPAFNIADAAILLGVFLLLMDMLFFSQNTEQGN